MASGEWQEVNKEDVEPGDTIRWGEDDGPYIVLALNPKRPNDDDDRLDYVLWRKDRDEVIMGIHTDDSGPWHTQKWMR